MCELGEEATAFGRAGDSSAGTDERCASIYGRRSTDSIRNLRCQLGANHTRRAGREVRPHRHRTATGAAYRWPVKQPRLETPMRRDSLPVAGLVLLYLAAIVAANVLTAHFGPPAAIYNAFALIGLDLITRDRLADFWGTSRWAKQAALILAGALLSYAATSGAHKVAVASAISFACAEVGEALLYWVLRRRVWLERANVSAWLGAAIDSLVFPTLAFGGFVWSTSFGQFAAKVAGAVVWSLVIVKLATRRAEAIA